MTTVAHPPASDTNMPRPGLQTSEMRVSAYDNVASMLIALILILGFFVTMMFLVWLTTVLTFSTPAVEVELVEEYAGRGEHAKGYARDLEEPGMEELEELETPQLEATLEAVTDAVTSVAASLDSLNTDALISGKGSGLGDSRKSGPGGEGEDIIPRWERWQIRYATDSLTKYAEQLDFFGIELAAAGGGSEKVEYAKSFSRGRAQRRSGDGDAEKRLYMTWTSGALRAADRQLLQRAGIRVQPSTITLQFYPQPIENDLAVIELSYAQPKNKTVKDIRRTIFGVKQTGGRYEYYVIDQVYRW